MEEGSPSTRAWPAAVEEALDAGSPRHLLEALGAGLMWPRRWLLPAGGGWICLRTNSHRRWSSSPTLRASSEHSSTVVLFPVTQRTALRTRPSHHLRQRTRGKGLPLFIAAVVGFVVIASRGARRASWQLPRWSPLPPPPVHPRPASVLVRDAVAPPPPPRRPSPPRQPSPPVTHPARPRGLPDEDGFYTVLSRSRSPPKSPGGVPADLVGLCFRCLREGHTRAHCTFPERCYNCGDEGHRVAVCSLPRRTRELGVERRRSPSGCVLEGRNIRRRGYSRESADTVSAYSGSTGRSFSVPNICAASPGEPSMDAPRQHRASSPGEPRLEHILPPPPTPPLPQ